MPPSWDRPPIDMPMPEGLERGATIFFVVSAALICVAAVVAARRTGSWVYPMLLVGGALCTFNEPMLNIPAKIWHARSDHFHLVTLFDRPMPLWVPFAYLMFFSALPGILLMVLHRGGGYRQAWLTMGAFWVLNGTVEVLLTGEGGLYTYYGYQPFAIADWAMDQLVTNGTGIAGIAVLLFKAPRLFQDARALLAIPLVPVMQVAALAVATPGFWVINTDIGHGWQWLGMAVALAIGVATIDALLRFATGTAQLGVPDEADPAEAPPALSRTH